MVWSGGRMIQEFIGLEWFKELLRAADNTQVGFLLK